MWILLSLMVISCGQERSEELPELDLMRCGMPIVIRAPEGATVKTMDLVLSKDITVIKGDFHLQIFESEADSRDLNEIKQRLLEEVRNHTYFDTVLLEDKAGFIYSTRVNENYTNYGFRYVRIQGDNEYVFQQGLGGKFSREAIDVMYRAVQ
jgi:hypothetical protein